MGKRKAKERSAVEFSPGDVIQIFGPCKLVHVSGRGGKFTAFRAETVPAPRVRRGKRLVKSKENR